MKTIAMFAVALIAAFTGCRTPSQTSAPPRPSIVLEIQKQEHGPTTARAQIIFGNTH